MKAATVKDTDAKSTFLTIAESYQLLARLTEQETAGGQIGESTPPMHCHIVDKAKNE